MIRAKELEYARQFIESAQHLYPEIAGGVMGIYTDGAMPKYTPLQQKATPDDGYPHNVANTTKIMVSMWGDMKGFRAIIRNTSSLVYGERLEYIPATAAPIRLPDRTVSDKSGAIPDLRRASMGVNTDVLFPIWIPATKHIAGGDNS